MQLIDILYKLCLWQVAALLFLILSAPARSNSDLDVGALERMGFLGGKQCHQHPSGCVILQMQPK